MPALSASLPADAARLIDGLVAVGALDPDAAVAACSRFLEQCPDGDATLLADHLAQHGLVSTFQAERALVDGPERLELGRYLLVEPVGNGSIGTTFLALARPENERYALRVLPLRSTWRVLQARQRLNALAALPPHPAVVPFADIDSAAGRHFLAWKWADGLTLDRHVLKHGPFAPAEAVRYFAELADGLHLLHAAGLPHGLLRPRSLLLGPDRHPRLLDLGLGGILADNVAEERSMVDTLALANGSAAMIDYAAPETLLDPTSISAAADAYSFGCCLYFALTGLPPFPEERLSEKVISHQLRSPVPLPTRCPAAPRPLADLVERLMRKAADERPSRFDELRSALREIAALPELASEVPTSKLYMTVKAEALAALGDSVGVPMAYTRRAELPPASDVIDFDDVPVFRAAPPPEDDDLPPVPAPHQPVTPAPTIRTNKPAPERRLPAADTAPRPRAAVEIPPPPVFDSAAARAARSVLFWKKPADAVQLSLFGPVELTPGLRARVLVYAHLPEAFGGVATLCRALNPDAELLGGGYVQQPVVRGSALQLHLTVGGAVVPKSMADLTWVGQTQPRSFEVVVPHECPTGPTDAVLSAGFEQQKVGEVRFQLAVRGRSRDRAGG